MQSSRTNLSALLRQLRFRIEGQDLIEYALLLAVISAGVLITVTQLGIKVPGLYTTTAAALPGGAPADEDPGDQEPPGGGPGNPGNGNPGGGNRGGGNRGGGGNGK